MADVPDLISERISWLLEDADKLRAEVKRLARDVRKRDGIESIDYLADVPGELGQAEQCMDDACKFLDSATTLAKRGGC